MIRRPPRSTQSRSSAASDVYKRQVLGTAQLEAEGDQPLAQLGVDEEVRGGQVGAQVAGLESRVRVIGPAGLVPDLEQRVRLLDVVGLVEDELRRPAEVGEAQHPGKDGHGKGPEPAAKATLPGLSLIHISEPT